MTATTRESETTPERRDAERWAEALLKLSGSGSRNLDAHGRPSQRTAILRGQTSELLERLKSVSARMARPHRDNGAGNDFDRMTAHPNVVSVSLDDTHLTVVTTVLPLDPYGPRNGLGPFKIQLNLHWHYSDFGDQSIRLHNLGYRPTWHNRRWDHPHVYDGKPCLGNCGKDLNRLTRAKRYGVAVALLIRYLKTWNPDDTGACHPEHFAR